MSTLGVKAVVFDSVLFSSVELMVVSLPVLVFRKQVFLFKTCFTVAFSACLAFCSGVSGIVVVVVVVVVDVVVDVVVVVVVVVDVVVDVVVTMLFSKHVRCTYALPSNMSLSFSDQFLSYGRRRRSRGLWQKLSRSSPEAVPWNRL